MPQFGLSDHTLTLLRNLLAGCAAVDQAVIYGSRAKGNFKPGSDIDLTLIGTELTPNILAQLAGQLEESSLPYQVDLSLRDHIDNPSLLDHIERVGQVLYTRHQP